jgi:hypothetical protein
MRVSMSNRRQPILAADHCSKAVFSAFMPDASASDLVARGEEREWVATVYTASAVGLSTAVVRDRLLTTK